MSYRGPGLDAATVGVLTAGALIGGWIGYDALTSGKEVIEDVRPCTLEEADRLPIIEKSALNFGIADLVLKFNTGELTESQSFSAIAILETAGGSDTLGSIDKPQNVAAFICFAEGLGYDGEHLLRYDGDGPFLVDLLVQSDTVIEEDLYYRP